VDSIAKLTSQWSQSFPGFLITVDNIPPYALFFSFAPEFYEDEWEAEFDAVTSPGSRYTYPMYKGNSIRKVKFQLKFDSSYPVTTPDVARRVRSKVGDGNSFWNHIKNSHDLEVAKAILEKLKLPKQGVSTVAASVLGGFTKIRPGVSDPSPPLVLVVANPLKYYLGYMGKSIIKPLKHNKWMQVTRMTADCTLTVTPDYIFTTLEDAFREINAILGWVT
jgi:hypothetical protein